MDCCASIQVTLPVAAAAAVAAADRCIGSAVLSRPPYAEIHGASDAVPKLSVSTWARRTAAWL